MYLYTQQQQKPQLRADKWVRATYVIHTGGMAREEHRQCYVVFSYKDERGKIKVWEMSISFLMAPHFHLTYIFG